MPIVLSYESVETLGALSMQTGQMAGQADRQRFDQGLLQQYDQSRNQSAVQLQSIQAGSENAAADRSLRMELAGQQQNMQREAWARQDQQHDQQLAAGMQQAEMQQAARLQQELMQQQGRFGMEKFRHDLGMQRLQYEVDTGIKGPSGQAAPTLGPGGFPTKDHARNELTQHGHLIPFDVRTGGGGKVVREQENQMEIAEAILNLPTQAIEQRVQQQPDDPWAPFMSAIIEARGAVQPGRDAEPRQRQTQGYARPEAGRPRRPGQQGMTGNGEGAAGSGNGFQSMSDAELWQYAQQLGG